MERKNASDFPQELLDLFHLYVHGEIDRAAFLSRAGKFADGGLTAADLLAMLKPNYAWAQQVPKDDKRIRTEYATVSSPQGNGSIKGYLVREPRFESVHRRRRPPARHRELHGLCARRLDLARADVPKIKAAILVHHGELDTRLASTWPAYDAELTAAKIPHAGYIYPNANHGFHNDTTPRYDAAAAKLAWQRTLDWFNRYLAR